MNRLIIATGLCIAATQSWAGSSAILPGSLSTTGPSSDHHSLFAATVNPALADLSVQQNESWRLNYFAGLGTNIEIGDANGFIDDLDELIDILDDPSSSSDSVDETLDRFNSALEVMGEQGYIKNTTRLYIPGLPLYFRPSFIPGTVFVEAAVDTQWRLGLLNDDLRYNDQNSSFETSTAAYIKSGIQTRFSVGYGREIFSELSWNRISGQLHAGAKVNVYKMELSKQVFQLQLLDGKDIDDVVQDEYENNLESSAGVGIDVGVAWNADHYRVGLTLNDINSPEFEYGALGENCESFADASEQRSNCELSRYFAESTGKINASEVHTKHATATIDATVFPTSSWAISSSMELAAYDDFVGSENQWMSISTSYTPKNLWIPALRVGMHRNMVGSELTSYGLGLTLFKFISLDVATSSETVEHDGSEAPRRFSFSLSFEESF